MSSTAARSRVTATGKELVLLGPDGSPIRGRELPSSRAQEVRAKALLGSFSSYLQGLSSVRLPAAIRARDPYTHHPWVAAAGRAIATAASIAPFLIYRETPDELARRRTKARAAGRTWVGPRAGRARRSRERWLDLRGLRRLELKGTEPDWDHPLVDVLRAPNPYQDGGQLFELTHLWIAIRGEIFWVLADPDGGSLAPGQTPGQIWPLSPDGFEPRMDPPTGGPVVGWWYRPELYLPAGIRGQAAAAGQRVSLEMHEVVQFKSANPGDSLRGLSRLTAMAEGVETDLMLRIYNRSLLEHEGLPRGVLEYEGMLTGEEETAYRQKWEELHASPENAGRTALLHGGFKFNAAAMSPSDMGFSGLARMDREEILATMGVPQSVLGITEDTNYATALAQHAGFWEHTISPMLRLEERTLDRTLLYPETDDTFGAFDLSGVEALRVGIAEKLTTATGMAGGALHAPPRIAYQLLGLDVPSYVGDDVALVPAFSTPLSDVLTGEAASELSGITVEDRAAFDADGIWADGQADIARRAAAPILLGAAIKLKLARARSRWKDFLKVQTKLENGMRKAYRAWVKSDKSGTLERFDAAAKGKTRKALIDLTAILQDVKVAGDALKSRTRPISAASIEQAYLFTLDEIGIPVFELDAPEIVRFFDMREKLFIQRVPQTLYDNLRATLTEGIQLDETIAQLRLRVAQSYDLAASAPKALTIARTETGGLFNGLRNEMFGLQGISLEQWSTAADEVVRPTHVLYGAGEPQPRGFNYLELSGGQDGALRFPHDPDGPAGEVINCRCLMAPIE